MPLQARVLVWKTRGSASTHLTTIAAGYTVTQNVPVDMCSTLLTEVDVLSPVRILEIRAAYWVRNDCDSTFHHVFGIDKG